MERNFVLDIRRHVLKKIRIDINIPGKCLDWDLNH